jgi:single-stranded-DNA-specific exonuclease
MSVEEMISKLPPGLWDAAVQASQMLLRSSRVTIASHIDADGISAAAIASVALERAGISWETEFFKKLDEGAIAQLAGKGADVTWYTDLGSGLASRLQGTPAIVSDHHVPDDAGVRGRSSGQLLLTDFSSLAHVNPALFGASGATELSGAGATLLVALALSPRNADLSSLAIVGAVGDLQDNKERRLVGMNRLVLSLAVESGVVEATEDIRYFGRETRPVHKMLEYSSDPFIPGITGREEDAIGFLLENGLELKEGDSWRSWAMLSQDEKDLVIGAIRDRLERARRKPGTIARLTGETYALTKESPGSPLRDGKEFATMLNACGRHGRPEVGMRICSGDRGPVLSEGMALLRDHRSAISQALEDARGKGVTRLEHIQYFDAGDEIQDTIVGTIAGMLLNANGSDRSAPMIAFADSSEYAEVESVKVSSRGTQDLISMGLDLSVAMRNAAGEVGGIGGGHNIAAGATIPADRKQDFLRVLDSIVGSQLTSARRQG